MFIPKNYSSQLNVKETEAAIKFIKDRFQRKLSKKLNLLRVSAPLFVTRESGINDYLSGTEKPVHFVIKDNQAIAEIVQSLAKWKRAALERYGFARSEGLYTDMNAIRPEEALDQLHSLYVDQWDWERIISKEERNISFLKSIVRKIYAVLRTTDQEVHRKYPKLGKSFLPRNIYFVHSEDLEQRFPKLTPKQREDAICKEHGAVFVIGIGAKLKNGKPHDLRAPDYDDWCTITSAGKQGLNGDILVWNPLFASAYEISSMGIRVDKDSLRKQLRLQGISEKKESSYHQQLFQEKLPLTIGGGIGQSRLCMLFLKKAHIGEVQSSIWPESMLRQCKKQNIILL